MSHTHYYEVDWESVEWLSAWPELVEEAPMIFEAADVLISGPGSDNATLTPPTADEQEGIIFSGFAQENGEEFRLGRNSEQFSINTGQKPYDTVVACVLLRAYMLAPGHFKVRSEGKWNGLPWIKARSLYKTLWSDDRLDCPWVDGEVESGDSNIFTITDMQTSTPSDRSGSTENIQPGLPGDITSFSTVPDTDFGPIRNWLAQCEADSNHAQCKASARQWRKIPGTSLKLIDLDQRCIVNAPDDCSYLVLGHVLRGANSLELTQKTSTALAEQGGLEALWSSISRTAQDAIIVCKALGERYLWVDCLCIMKDAPRDKRLQRLRMSQIYAGAKCLLAAVSANTTDHRLLQDPLGGQNRLAVAVRSAKSLQDLLTSSPWMSRAWSYQEMVFSHRALLFTSAGIFLQCQKGTYNATGALITTPAAHSRAQVKTVGGMLRTDQEKGLKFYLSAVEDYSQRDFTEEEDRRDAFKAIIRAYRGYAANGQYWTIWYGQPLFAFDQTICWRTPGHHPHLRNREFPSWSWLGWHDRVAFDRRLIREIRTSQMIEFPHGSPPLNHPRMPIYGQDLARFGFPTSSDGRFSDGPGLSLYASLAKLRISETFEDSDDTNGRYPVYPLDATPPESLSPLGDIWLDRDWREEHAKDGVEFIALYGECRSRVHYKWTITVLMAIEPHGDADGFLGWERVQLMACKIPEERWVSLGGRTVKLWLI